MAAKDGDYRSFDDPEGYIKGMFSDSPQDTESTKLSDSYQQAIPRFLMKCLAEYFKGLERSDSSLKILDYGCGPTVAYSISASSKASEIVLAEYNQLNRKYLQKWVNGEPSFTTGPHTSCTISKDDRK